MEEEETSSNDIEVDLRDSDSDFASFSFDAETPSQYYCGATIISDRSDDQIQENISLRKIFSQVHSGRLALLRRFLSDSVDQENWSEVQHHQVSLFLSPVRRCQHSTQGSDKEQGDDKYVRIFSHSFVSVENLHIVKY